MVQCIIYNIVKAVYLDQVPKIKNKMQAYFKTYFLFYLCCAPELFFLNSFSYSCHLQKAVYKLVYFN